MRHPLKTPESWDRYDHEVTPEPPFPLDSPDDFDDPLDDFPELPDVPLDPGEIDFEAAFDDEEQEPQRGDFAELDVEEGENDE